IADGGHSINFVKFSRNAALTWYSSDCSERASSGSNSAIQKIRNDASRAYTTAPRLCRDGAVFVIARLLAIATFLSREAGYLAQVNFRYAERRIPTRPPGSPPYSTCQG